MSSRLPEELKDLIIVHPRGLPCLADKEGNLYLCCTPKTLIGTWNKATDEFSLKYDDDEMRERISQWRAEQTPRERTKRITEFSCFPKKMPVAKQSRTTRPKAAASAASK